MFKMLENLREKKEYWLKTVAKNTFPINVVSSFETFPFNHSAASAKLNKMCLYRDKSMQSFNFYNPWEPQEWISPDLHGLFRLSTPSDAVP